ncbi:2-dehydro-3-deoxygalactonokinase [Altererythrobacter salegens]|uniref:2-dehydro-3-deoxygalactonokinase n=1 Tax=Croceibacterium salegens TaxID=1737568 RepID=A0A6I4SXL6_9SPHN|nr:2-dehydro-3-deoxygalactonokinase [Croceibacterium salegens]
MSGETILGDWGGSHLRLWLRAGGKVVERRDGPGIAGLADSELALVEAVEGWDAARIVLCGMAGSRAGLREVPYLECPATSEAWKAGLVEIQLAGLSVAIAPGVCCRDEKGRPDVMRGEETQVFGALGFDPDLARGEPLFVLPGTHSKWAKVKDGRIASFRTFITGEMFALLAGSSLLSAGKDPAGEAEGFAAGLARAADMASAMSSLFEARAAQFCDGRTAGWARGFLSGLLIGGEVRELAPAQRQVVIVGEPELATRYSAALAYFGIESRTLDGELCAMAGLELLDDD